MAEQIRDTSHAFKKGGSDGEVCHHCGKPRWAHLYDGHSAPAEHKYDLEDTKYKPGPHPYWTRPGSFNKKPPVIHSPYPVKAVVA